MVDHESVSWYALQVRRNHERLSACALEGKGFETFLPLYRSERRWSDRVKQLELPLFSGYLFCRFDPQKRLGVMTSPGVVRIVGIGKAPVPVSDAEIEAIQTIAKSNLDVQPWPFLRVGQVVRIEGGPLYGLSGMLLEIRNEHRLVVGVTLLQRSVAVCIDRRWATPIDEIVPAVAASSY